MKSGKILYDLNDKYYLIKGRDDKAVFFKAALFRNLLKIGTKRNHYLWGRQNLCISPEIGYLHEWVCISCSFDAYSL